MHNIKQEFFIAIIFQIYLFFIFFCYSTFMPFFASICFLDTNRIYIYCKLHNRIRALELIL